MNKLSTTLLATALVGVVSLGAVASVSAANNNQRGGPGGGAGGGAGPISFACGEKGAERIENGLTRMSERLDLNVEQTASFDALKTSVLSAQASFSDVCADFKPADRAAAEDTDLIDRLNSRQAMMSAQLSAMSEVMPEFEAFFDSLTDEQKSQMRPDRSNGAHRHGPQGNNGQHSHGPNGNGPNGNGPQGGQNGNGPANNG